MKTHATPNSEEHERRSSDDKLKNAPDSVAVIVCECSASFIALGES